MMDIDTSGTVAKQGKAKEEMPSSFSLLTLPSPATPPTDQNKPEARMQKSQIPDDVTERGQLSRHRS